MSNPSQTKRRLMQASAAASAAVLLGLSGPAPAAEPSNLYVSIRRAAVKPGSAEELARRVPVEVLPVLRTVPGFVSFQMIYGENDMVTAITLYTSESAAREVNTRVIPMIRDVFSPSLAGPVEPSTGTLLISAKHDVEPRRTSRRP